MKLNVISSHKVLSLVALSNSHAKIVVRTTRNNSEGELRKLEASLNKNNMTIVASSVRESANDGNGLYRVFTLHAAARPKVIAANEVNKARMVAVASNMFMDGNDESVWEESNGQLVRRNSIESAQHLQNILTASVMDDQQPHSKEARTLNTALASAPCKMDGGMYAVFVDEGQTYDGYVVAMSEDGSKALVLPRPDGSTNYPERIIDVSAVVEAFNLEDLTTEVPTVPEAESAVLAAATTMTAAQALAYYKKVYGYNTEYFRKFSEMLRSRGVYA